MLACDSLDMTLNVDFSLAVPKILFHPCIETSLWKQRYGTAGDSIRRAYFNFETKRMAGFETEMCNRFDLVVVASEQDRDELRREYGVRTPIEVIPTGVDCEYFRPVERQTPVSKRLMFSGSMDLLSNVDQLLWFAAEIYPLIKRRHPDVTLEIVGRSPTSELRALEQADRIVICSDGLFAMVGEREMERISSKGSPEKACLTLVKRAKEEGGSDNITVIIAEKTA